MLQQVVHIFTIGLGTVCFLSKAFTCVDFSVGSWGTFVVAANLAFVSMQPPPPPPPPPPTTTTTTTTTTTINITNTNITQLKTLI